MTRTYLRDEFDVEDPGTGRRGAHRAKPNPLVAVVPLVLVTVAVVAVIVGTMTLLGGSGTSPVAETGTQSPAEETPAEEAPTEEPPAETPAPSETPSETPEPEATVDMALPVTVLNGTRTEGLAGQASAALSEAGYNVVATDNFRQGTPPPTTVYYAADDATATAEAIAEELGGAAEQDTERGEGITVILGEDYTP